MPGPARLAEPTGLLLPLRAASRTPTYPPQVKPTRWKLVPAGQFNWLQENTVSGHVFQRLVTKLQLGNQTFAKIVRDEEYRSFRRYNRWLFGGVAAVIRPPSVQGDV